MASIRMGTGDLAKYPFLKEAGDYVRDTGFDLQELERPEMKNIIDKAAERVELELSGGIYDGLDKFEIEILSFLVSLMIVKWISIEQVLRKFSLAEARRAEKFLTEDLKHHNEVQRQLLIAKIFDEIFNLKIGIEEKNHLFKVRISDYLSRASHFHEPEWKLINRLVQGGHVYLDADETVRLVRNELSVLIYEKIKSMTLPNLPPRIKANAESLHAKLVHHYQYRPTVIADYPPCVKHALEVMGKGENLPHSARVMLATYMLAIGKSVEEIIMMYKDAPDFNEKITRYQVEHLAGMRGSRKKYSVPSCDRLRNDSLCFETADCSGIINPIQFGRKRK